MATQAKAKRVASPNGTKVLLSSIMDQTAEAVAEVGDLKVWIKYRSHVLTVERFMKIAADDPDAAGDMAEQLAEVLIDWNVDDGSGDFPPTAENIGKIPLDLLAAIQKAMQRDEAVGEASGSFGDG